MSIESLRVQNCRILSHLEIAPSPTFNLIVGPNGSGKSSLLEAIALLGSGRSFRTNTATAVVQEGAASLIVSADVSLSNNRHFSIGMERGKERQRLLINRSPVQKLSEVAELLPLQIITPESIDLVMGPPRNRRSFLDWGLFHVEPQFLSLTKNYRKVLRQRNALLKKGSSDDQLEYWNRELICFGEAISAARAQYVDELIDHYQNKSPFSVASLSSLQINFEYRKGWKGGVTLEEALKKSAHREKMVGHTVAGPQEADLLIRAGSEKAKQVLSRGQAKLLSIALYLSQISHLDEKTGKRGVVLVDDLFSELDRDHSLLVLDHLIESRHQAFVTAVDDHWVEQHAVARFHVEHGTIQKRSDS